MPHDEFSIVHSEFFINTQIERVVYTHIQFTNHSFLPSTEHEKKYQVQENPW